MGIDFVMFDWLADLSARWKPQGRSLMLGRQAYKVEEGLERRYRFAMRALGLEGEAADFLQPDGASETVFEKLGFPGMESLDFSAYEGATVVHDLNMPVPDSLHGQFDFIFDGGTIEHVFDVPAALRNVFHMLKPGGRFVSFNGMNGWPAHGIYQFNPELVWTFWARTAGCKVHRCCGVKKRQGKAVPHLHFPDPAEKGNRLKLKGKLPEGRVYLAYEVEKLPSSALGQIALQSDYETLWVGHAKAGETHVDGAANVRRRTRRPTITLDPPLQA